MTEACGFLSLALPSDPVDTRINTGGHPLPGMEARICDPETGQVLPPGGIGEICFKGPNTFDGYYLEPELTASCFDDEGYFKTGDLGHMDEDGRVTYRNRIKDMLKVVVKMHGSGSRGLSNRPSCCTHSAGRRCTRCEVCRGAGCVSSVKARPDHDRN